MSGQRKLVRGAKKGSAAKREKCPGEKKNSDFPIKMGL